MRRRVLTVILIGIGCVVGLTYLVTTLTNGDDNTASIHDALIMNETAYTAGLAQPFVLFQQPAAPKVVFLTAKSRGVVPDYVMERFKKFTVGYSIEFFDDQRCRHSLYPFGPKVVAKFDGLRGAHKADLWRYCMMFLHGGVYCDIKTVLTRQISEISPRMHHNYTVISISMNGESMYNGFLSMVPRNPIMMECINHILDTPLPVRNYLVFCKFMYVLLEKYLGKVQVGTTRDWTFYQETKTTKCARRDWYGHCQLEWRDANNKMMSIVRDPDYPWEKNVAKWQNK